MASAVVSLNANSSIENNGTNLLVTSQSQMQAFSIKLNLIARTRKRIITYNIKSVTVMPRSYLTIEIAMLPFH